MPEGVSPLLDAVGWRRAVSSAGPQGRQNRPPVTSSISTLYDW